MTESEAYKIAADYARRIDGGVASSFDRTYGNGGRRASEEAFDLFYYDYKRRDVLESVALILNFFHRNNLIT